MKLKMKRFLGLFLSLALVLGLMPGMSLTAYAESTYTIVTKVGMSQQTTYKQDASLPCTCSIEDMARFYNNSLVFGGNVSITQNGNNISVEGENIVVTAEGTSQISFRNSATNGTFYLTIEVTKNTSVTGVTLNPSTAQTIEVGGSVAFTVTVEPSGATDKTVKWSTTGGVTLYSDSTCNTPITTGTATSTLTVYAKGISAGSATVTATSNADSTKTASCDVTVNAETRSVTVTPGSNMTKTTASGATSQTGLSGAMTPVVYTANTGYYFPTNYSVTAVNNITVTRDSYTQITVSGTPTADTTITLTAPTAKTTPDAPTTAAAVNCTTAENNDGKLTGVTTAMEYKKSDATEWTAGTGSDITGLVPGTYYVRVKATDTTNVSNNQELTIVGYTAPTPTPTPTPKPVPKTGDQDHPGLWIILMLIGIAGLTVLGTLKVSRKRK